MVFDTCVVGLMERDILEVSACKGGPCRGGTRPDFGRGRAIEVSNTYPFLIPIFPKCIPDFIPIYLKYVPDFIPIFRKCIPDPKPIAKIAKTDTVPYAKIVKIDTLPDGTSLYPKYV